MGGPAGLPGITPATILPCDPPNVTHSVVLRPTGHQTLHTVWFGDRQTAKRYTQCDLETDGPPNVTHSMVWRPTPRQTSRTAWFGDRRAAKRYTHCGDEANGPPNVTQAVVW